MLFSKKKESAPAIFTEETCRSCGIQTKRQFVDGDYVFRSGSRCTRCTSDDVIISGVYGEYPHDAEKDAH